MPCARGHVANLKGLVLVCYLSARHRPSQVTATPQPICVITAAFSHFPDNVLHPQPPELHPSSITLHPPSLFYPSLLSVLPSSLPLSIPLTCSFFPSASPSHAPTLSLSLFQLPPHLASFFPSSPSLILSHCPFSPSTPPLLPLPPVIPPPFLPLSFTPSLYLSHSAALSSHPKVLDFDICLQEQ